MFDSALLFTALTFFTVVLAGFGVYSLVADLYLRDRNRFSRRVDEEFRKRQRDQVKKSSLFKNLTQLAGAASADNEPRLSLGQRIDLFVEQSGLLITPQRLLGYIVGFTVVLGLGAGLFRALFFGSGFSRDSILLGLVGAGIGASMPILYVIFKRKQRMEKLLNQLPEALDLMARILRAGQTMSQAMQGVGDEFEQPIAAEFAYCYEQQNLGLPYEVAFRDLAQRTGLLEVKILVMALLVQQQTGGNLAQLLENLATVIRDRLRMRGKIKALTAEGRMQAIVLLGLPFLLFFVMLFLNPGYTQILLDYPWMLVGMAVLMLLGALWIRKIIQFDF